jgi:hypothetical protein
MKMFLILLLVSANLWAQSTATVSAPANTSTSQFGQFSWERIRARTKIGYMNFATGPSIKKWDDNEISDQGTKNREPVAMYHSFQGRFNLVGQNDLFIVPRFVTAMGNPGDLRPQQDHHTMMMDDWDFGFYRTIVKTPTLDYGISTTWRQAWSVKTRDNENVNHFYVYTNWLNWAVSNDWRLLHWSSFTYYDFNQDSSIERYRFNLRTLMSYSFNDMWSSQIGYEIDMQHVNPKDGANDKHRDANFFKRYHSYITAGLGVTPIHHWTFMPYLRAMDERNIRNETLAVGFMVFGKVL